MSETTTPTSSWAGKAAVVALCGVTSMLVISPPEIVSPTGAPPTAVVDRVVTADPSFSASFSSRLQAPITPTVPNLVTEASQATIQVAGVSAAAVEADPAFSASFTSSIQTPTRTERLPAAPSVAHPDGDQPLLTNLAIPVPQVAVHAATTATQDSALIPEAEAAWVTSADARLDALMRLNHAWQLSVETATLHQYHLQTALPMLERSRTEAAGLTEQLQALSSEVAGLRAELAESEALRRSLEVEVTAAAVQQPPPVIDTPPPPLPTPIAVNPAAASTVAPPPAAAATEPLPDPVPDILVAVSHLLGSTTATEIRSTPGLTVTADMPAQLNLTGAHVTAENTLDSYSSDILNSTITISAPGAAELNSRLFDYLESALGVPAESSDTRSLFYGVGQDVELVARDATTATISIVHTGLGVGPIQVFDAPPEPAPEPAPLVTRYD